MSISTAPFPYGKVIFSVCEGNVCRFSLSFVWGLVSEKAVFVKGGKYRRNHRINRNECNIFRLLLDASVFSRFLLFVERQIKQRRKMCNRRKFHKVASSLRVRFLQFCKKDKGGSIHMKKAVAVLFYGHSIRGQYKSV